MMKLVTQTDLVGERFGDMKGIEMLCKAGFDGIDYSMFAMQDDDNVLNSSDWKSYVLALRDMVEGYGKTFEQSHAPFPSMRRDDEAYNKKLFPRIARAIEITGILGGKVCVVHPSALGEGQFEKNIEFYNKLAPVAKESGVKIALENMWGRDSETRRICPNICSVAEDFNRYTDALDPEVFTACLDLGHCGLVGETAAEMIKDMGGERITALHIHDNDNLSDKHTIPYLCAMNWADIFAALGEINYSGNFTYEADNFLKGFPDELIPDCLDFMVRIGRFMMGEIEKNRVKA